MLIRNIVTFVACAAVACNLSAIGQFPTYGVMDEPSMESTHHAGMDSAMQTCMSGSMTRHEMSKCMSNQMHGDHAKCRTQHDDSVMCCSMKVDGQKEKACSNCPGGGCGKKKEGKSGGSRVSI